MLNDMLHIKNSAKQSAGLPSKVEDSKRIYEILSCDGADMTTTRAHDNALLQFRASISLLVAEPDSCCE